MHHLRLVKIPDICRAKVHAKFRDTDMEASSMVHNVTHFPRRTGSSTLIAEPACRSVAADEDHLVAEREHFGPYALDQQVVVAHRQIRATDGTGENHIADQRHARALL